MQMHFLLLRVAGLILQPCGKASWQSRETSGRQHPRPVLCRPHHALHGVCAGAGPSHAGTSYTHAWWLPNKPINHDLVPSPWEAGHRLQGPLCQTRNLLEMCCVRAPSYAPGFGCGHIYGSSAPKELMVSWGCRSRGTLPRKPKTGSWRTCLASWRVREAL